MQAECALEAQRESYAGAPTGFRKLIWGLLRVDRCAEALRDCAGRHGAGAAGVEGPRLRKRTVRKENTDKFPVISTQKRRFHMATSTYFSRRALTVTRASRFRRLPASLSGRWPDGLIPIALSSDFVVTSGVG